jgi:hypothetical protein
MSRADIRNRRLVKTALTTHRGIQNREPFHNITDISAGAGIWRSSFSLAIISGELNNAPRPIKQ